MNRKIFTDEQIKELSRNKNVRRCGAKSVRYKRSFKESALRLYHEEGLSAVEIFKNAGFDLNIIGIRKPNKLMHQWSRAPWAKKDQGLSLQEGEKTEVIMKRIGSRREVDHLKAKVEYLETENRFLAQLRAGKRQ